MNEKRSVVAYPGLLPNNSDAGDPRKGWRVEEVAETAVIQGGVNGAATDKTGKVLRVPKPIFQHDVWIRLHELYHVKRPMMVRSKNNFRNLVRKMLEEVALDAQALAEGFDLRPARDKYDWKQAPSPSDEYDAMRWYLQIWTSAQVSTNEDLQKFADRVKDVLTAAGKLDDVERAARAVFRDYSSGNCEDWTDILASKFVPPKGEEPEEPPEGDDTEEGEGTTCGIPGTGSDDDDSGSDEEASASEEDDEGDEESDAGDEEDGDEETEDGEEEGELDDGEDAEGESEGEEGEGGEGSGTGDGEEAEGTPGAPGNRPGTVEVNKPRHNEPTELSYDPLTKEVNLYDEPETPPESYTQQRLRKELEAEELDRLMQEEAQSRKQGEGSLSEELTIQTPHGLVDVHRHTLTRYARQATALTWRSSEDGAMLRYPERLYQGGRVFATRAPGGSIILDGSGSMDWHMSIIVETIKSGRIPRLYVAFYSYHGGQRRNIFGGPRTDEFIARYCVVAQDGKVVDEMPSRYTEHQHSGGNSGADPASLAYALRRAPRPIVWVSDGMVGGKGYDKFVEQCDELMHRGRIVRVLTIEHAVDYLTGKAVPGWTQCATVNTQYVRTGMVFRQEPGVHPYDTTVELQKWTRKFQEGKLKR